VRPLAELLAELAALDVKLLAEGERLRINAPRGALAPALEAELRARKGELLAALGDGWRGQARLAPVHQAHLAPGPRDGELALSCAQERLLALAALAPQSNAYNIAAAFRLVGKLDVAALERSLAAVEERHEVLRTAYSSGPCIAPAAPGTLPITDWSGLPEARRGARAAEEVACFARRPFDLARGPVWRCTLLRLAERDHVLALAVHHVAFDGQSKDVLLADIAALYAAFARGEPADLAPLPVQYVDFAAWQRRWLEGDGARRQLAYWEAQLGGGLGELVLPADRARARHAGARGPAASHARFELPPALAARLSALSREQDASLFHTLLAGFHALLFAYTAQEDQVLCSPVAGRGPRELEGLIGCFNNLVAIRSDLSRDPSFRALLGRVRSASLAAYENQDLPFQRVAELPCLARTPLARALFSLRYDPRQTLQLAGLESTPFTLRKETPDFDLAMYVEVRRDGLGGILEYDTRLFEESTVSGLLARYRELLERAVDGPDRPLSELAPLCVEPARVARLLEAHAQVQEAVVVGRGRAHPGVAYVVPSQEDVPSADALREHAAQRLPHYAVPAAFVPLDALPRTPDGGVDRAALAGPRRGEHPIRFAPAEDRPTRSRVPPRTALEKALAELWTEVLWLDREVGIEDDFFELGGHSLLAAALFAKIEERLGRPLPIGALRELGTVARLAGFLERAEEERAVASPGARAPAGAASGLAPEILRGLVAHTTGWKGERAGPEALVFGLNTRGSRQPLFWCCQGLNEFTQLSEHLGEDQPLYAMRSGHRVMQKTPENIAALAAHYAGEIRAVQARGPYLLGGNCQAGAIALQIARRMRAEGREVTLLCMMEKFVPDDYAGRVAFLFANPGARSPYRYFRDPALGWRKYYTGGFALHRLRGDHGQLFREPNVQVLAAELTAAIAAAQRAPQEPRASDEPPAARWQMLPERAYRARIGALARVPLRVPAGAPLALRVRVQNQSPETWAPTERSGIVLANRWLDGAGRTARWLDGQARLAAALGPGQSVELRLEMAAPGEPGDHVLELDMVDEGVAWFGEKGSAVQHVPVVVQVPRPSLLRRLAGRFSGAR